MKIYTKTGDKGETSLVSGRRISKADALIDAYGTVDELNSFVGLLLTEVSLPDLVKDLTFIQNLLFNIGSLLAKDGADFPNYPTIEEKDALVLERRMDILNESLEKMTAFILPSGSKSISYAHVCRTVTRKAERKIIDLKLESIDNQRIVIFLNRLSDYFFVLARYFHMQDNIPEIKWDNDHRSKL